MKQVAIIGLGNMGMAMAMNLAAKGFSVRGYARRPGLNEVLRGHGGTPTASAAEAVHGADTVFLMVMNGDQVLQVLRETRDALRPGATVIVTATIGLQAMQQAEGLLNGTGVALLDCPVSGGRGGAEGGTLTLMAAGPTPVLDAQREVLGAIGTRLFHVGESVGQGQVAKACLQALIGVVYEGLFEAMVLGGQAGLDPRVLAELINHSFVGSRLTQATTERIVERQFTGGGSAIGTMHKDFGISLDMARALGVPMPAASVAMQMFQAGQSVMPEADNWGIVLLLEQLASAAARKETT